MPLTPPAALISLIAIMVASCSDFSTIERPPVSENNTPTFPSPAALAPVWKTQGEVITVLEASKPFLRNLRLSIAITPLPMCQGTASRSRRSTFVANQKNSQIGSSLRKRTGVGGVTRPRKQKSPTDPRGSFGLPSQSQTSSIDGSANVRGECSSPSTSQKLITFHAVLQ